MNKVLHRPIAILDEHPEWSSRLIAELEGRRLPYEKVDHSNHAYDPRDMSPRRAARCCVKHHCAPDAGTLDLKSETRQCAGQEEQYRRKQRRSVREDPCSVVCSLSRPWSCAV